MTNSNEFATKVFAAFGAVAISLTLFVSSFADPAATSVVSLLA
ncbi:hypothetical protein [Aurantiacibacter marinus]|nr:hypothetical protein [Aurantiacibacter marinus]